MSTVNEINSDNNQKYNMHIVLQCIQLEEQNKLSRNKVIKEIFSKSKVRYYRFTF